MLIKMPKYRLFILYCLHNVHYAKLLQKKKIIEFLFIRIKKRAFD